MNKEQMKEYIRKNVKKQGTMGALALAPLLSDMVDQIFAGGGGGDSGTVGGGDDGDGDEEQPQKPVASANPPVIIAIAGDGTKEGTKTTYQVSTGQAQITEAIAKLSEKKAEIGLFVEDGDLIIGFQYIENDGDTVTAVSSAPDGAYKLYLSKEAGKSYFEHDEATKAIASVTESEIEAYKEVFGAVYDPVKNKFDVQIGTVHTQLTPGQMMLTNEEYNKVSTNGDYTAMWANSKAEYICCAPFFFGFMSLKLHSSFFESKNVVFIDLNKDELSVSDLTNAFYGCERLEQITGVLDVGKASFNDSVFYDCKVLHSVKIQSASGKLDFHSCDQISPESIEFAIRYSNPGKNLVIVVSENVKNKIDNEVLWSKVRESLTMYTNVTIKEYDPFS